MAHEAGKGSTQRRGEGFDTGHGRIWGERCPKCRGKGYIVVARNNGLEQDPCPGCTAPADPGEKQQQDKEQ